MQYNIFHNDFYEELPGLSWAYRLDVLLGESPEPILRLGKAVKEVDLPEAELKVQQAFFSGLVFRIPIRYKNSGTFSITFNDNKRLDVYRDLMRLFRRSYDNREQNNVPASEEFREMYQTIGYDYKRRKYSDLSQELSFVIYEIDPRKINYRDTQLVSEVNNEELRIVGLETNDPEVVAKYTIRDCYIENIEEITFDYSSEECVEWPLKVHFNSFKVDYQNQDKIYMPEHEPDGFEMENLDMTGYLPDSESRYIAKLDPKRENDVDPDGNAAKSRMTHNEALKLAQSKLKEIQEDTKEERKLAVMLAESDANEFGVTPEGLFTTARAREEHIEETMDPYLQDLKAETNYEQFKEWGIDLDNSDLQAVLKQAEQSEKRIFKKEDYGVEFGDVGKSVIQKIKDPYKTTDVVVIENWKKWQEGKKELLKKESDYRMALTQDNMGTVEMGDKGSESYYRQRSYSDIVQERNERGTQIQSIEKVLEGKEDLEEAVGQHGKYRRAYVNRNIDQKAWEGQYPTTLKYIDSAKNKMSEGGEELAKKLKTDKQRAQTAEEIYGSDK